MTFIISNKEHQEKVKALSLPVFDSVEKLMRVFKANGDKNIYNNVQNGVMELNKSIFVYQDNKPTWDVRDIQNALHRLINSMPRIYRADVKYQELQDYLELFNGPVITKTGFVDKLKQLFNNIAKNAKLRVF